MTRPIFRHEGAGTRPQSTTLNATIESLNPGAGTSILGI